MNLKRLTAGILAMLAIAACKEETPYMELSQKKFTIGEEGGRINVELKANVYYRVVNENDFVTISAEGNDAETANYIIDVKANENIDARKARIKFIGDRVTPLALDITQKGKVPVGVDVSELNVSFSATSAEFRVLGDKEWTATCDNPDFVLSKTSGVGESKVEVTFPANTKEAPVTAVVTVTIGGQDYTLTITQEAAPAKERTDLGADGTSNCYIVSKPGYYKFKATVRGNGTLPESCDGEITVSITPDHADVLWCTYNTMTAPAAAESRPHRPVQEGTAAYLRQPLPPDAVYSWARTAHLRQLLVQDAAQQYSLPPAHQTPADAPAAQFLPTVQPACCPQCGTNLKGTALP